VDQRDEHELRSRAATLPLEWLEKASEGRADGSPATLLAIIAAAHVATEQAKRTLQYWIDVGRRAGVTWDDIGLALGITPQGANQRFGEPLTGEKRGARDEIVVPIGNTRMPETRILEMRGLQGQELIGADAKALHFRQTNQLWQYRRLALLGPCPLDSFFARGWQPAASWFPFLYLKRHTR
jgi:hypothetical protein